MWPLSLNSGQASSASNEVPGEGHKRPWHFFAVHIEHRLVIDRFGDLVNMRTIAMDQFDKNEGLFIFAVGKLEDMLNEFRAHYYAEEFPPT